MIFEILVFSNIAPLLLVPVEFFLPYPFLIEEIVKFFIASSLSSSKKSKLIHPLLAGFFFSFTENVLYVSNIIKLGNSELLINRFFYVGLMHTVTTLLMYLGTKKNKYFGFFSLIFAICIHFYFNQIFGRIR